MKTNFTIKIEKRRKAYLLNMLILLFGFSSGIFAQLNGSYTLGNDGDYSSFTEAFNALQTLGVSGPVIFNVIPGTYNEQVVYRQVPGASVNNPILFQSASGDSTDVMVQSAAATNTENYVMKLDSASYVSFRSISFRSTNSTYSNVIVFKNIADHVTFSHCVFQGHYYPYAGATRVLIYSSITKINSILLENNDFSQSSYGVYLQGANNDLLQGVDIRNNKFHNMAGAVYLAYAESPRVTVNSMDQCEEMGISINFSRGHAVVSKNILTNIGREGSIVLNRLNSSVGEEALISNNLISHGQNTNSVTSIYISYADHVKIYNNTVSVFCEHTSGSSTNSAIYFDHSDGSTIELVNNILNMPFGGYVLYLRNTVDLKRCDYNNYYTPGMPFAEWNGNTCVDFRAQQAASGDDAHSVFAWPGFTDVNDLHVRSAWIDGKGVPLADVAEDINGTPRDNSHPDIGAEEFTAAANLRTPLSGIRTIGSDYATLQEAMDDARIKGVSDTLKLQFPDGNYSGQYIINPIPGASSRHPVIIESVSGDAAKVIIQYAASSPQDNYILKLFGSSFVHVRDLSLWSTNWQACTVFQLNLLADSIILENCALTGADPGSSGSATTPLINSTNVYFHHLNILHNTLDLGNGISLSSYYTAFNQDDLQTEIKDNTFINGYSAITLRHLSPLITNNTITTTHYGIKLDDVAGSLDIHGNKVIAPYGRGIHLYNCDLPFVKPGKIMNNFIIAGNHSSFGNGMYIGNSENIQYYYNSVFLNADPAYATINVYALKLENNSSLYLQNNILSTNGEKYAVYVNNSTFFSADNNCYYTEGPVLGYWDQDCADLDAIKTASGRNGHSVDANPGFVSDTNLHATAAALDSAGVPIPGITEDIDGDLRDPQYPDIGADEFGATPGNFPPVAVNDTVQVIQGSSVEIAVLVNDSDPDGDAIHVTGTGTPAEGQITGVVNDTATYLTPMHEFAGMDSVIYHISDVSGLEDSAWIFINVMSDTNQPPVAVDDYAATFRGGQVTVDLLQNDSDPDQDSIWVVQIHSFLQGSAVLNQNRYIVYTAPENFTGIDSLEYILTDFYGHIDVAMVYINVNELPLEPVEIELDSYGIGTGLWGDYDMDGDMDIILGGVGEGNAYEVRVYEHDNGLYPSSTVITQVAPQQFDAMAWGDFDNDGDPDLIVSGYENTGLIKTRRTRLFQVENGQFTEIISGINMSNAGSVDWGDYDNDGDLDLLTGGSITRVYRNDGAGEAGMWKFTDVKTLPEVREGSAKWGDYDGDGDLDILLSSTLMSNAKLWLYENSGDGQFTEINTGIVNLEGRCIWYDYNQDGYPDVVVEGRWNDTLITKIYRNEAEGEGRKFTDIRAGLKGLEVGSLSFCDYDLDGNADLLVTGRDAAGKTWTLLYNYQWDGSFQDSGIELPGVMWGSGRWGDYNYDGKPDLLLTGRHNDPANPGMSGAYTGIFINRSGGTNTPPSPPSVLSEEVSGTSVILSWRPSTDQQSNARALTYNLRLGTHTGGSEVVSAMADPASGKLYVPGTGNIGYHMQWKINNLQLGRRYYWSVESVDPARAVSGFPEERSFVLEDGLFTENPFYVLQGLTDGDVEWGDYDNDNDLDLAMTGKTNEGTYISVIYKNNNGAFTAIDAGLQGIWKSSLAWGDYDNDGDLDLILTGRTSEDLLSGLTKIYRNDGNNVFTDIQAELINLSGGDVAWSDYDNDGDLDFLITGKYTEQVSATKIFRNDDGEFNLDMEVSMPGLSQSSLSFCDYDNDRDMDLLIAGLGDDGVPVTKVFRNDGGTFTEASGIHLPGIYDGTVAWMDYDNDSYTDIVITGDAGEEGPFTGIFRNDGSHNFYQTGNAPDAARNSTLAWGDLDLDGIPDLVIGSPAGVMVYLKEGNYRKELTLPGISNGSLALGDYTGDNRPDLVLMGADAGQNAYCKIYYNVSTGINHTPEVPEGLTAMNNDTGIIFQWESAGDWETSHDGLTYNLRVGTTPGGSEIMAPMSDPGNGTREVARPGNANQTLAWKLTGLETGSTYYWSVQSVDPSFAASAFALEQSVTWVPSHTVIGEIFLYSQMQATMTTVWALSINDEGWVSNIISADLTGTNRYEIHGVPEGRTTIEVFPVQGAYPDYLPTYLGSTTIFENADIFDLDKDTSVANIYLVHKPQSSSGWYNFGGSLSCSCVGDCIGCSIQSHVNVIHKSTQADTTMIPGTYIYLLDNKGDIITWAITDSLGNFLMDSIPEGKYTLYIDLVGLPIISDNDTIVFNEDHPEYKIAAVAGDTAIYVTFLDVTAVDLQEIDPGITVYPNPVKDNLSLRFDKAAGEDVRIRIIGIDGNIVKTLELKSIQEKEVLNISVSDLSPGMYILSIEGGKINYKARVVKQ